MTDITISMEPRISTNRFVALALLCASFCATQNQAKSATITGRVIGPDGSEIPNAKVWAMRVPEEGASGIAGDVHLESADNHGRFGITLQPGRYVVQAKAEEAGYPDPDATLSVDPTARFPTIFVGQSDISGIVVKLGKKGGVLEGYVYDAQSKTPVAGSKVTLRDPHNPQAIVELFPEKNGHFQFAVPSKPILVLAWAPRYKPLTFASGHPLQLSPGEHRNIVLELEHQ